MTKLTKRDVEALPLREKYYIVFDETLPRFGVRILPSGLKTFLVQYRTGGRTRRVKIGHFGVVTADEARKTALELLGAVAKGRNPAQEVGEHRAAPTVASVCDRFMHEHAALRCKPSTQKSYQWVINKIIKPEIGPFKIVDVARSDIARLHHKLKDTPYNANRVLQVLSKMFNLTEVWGLRADGSNPCRHVQKYKEKKRERYLSVEELRRLGQTLDAVLEDGTESIYVVAAFRLLILTGCRLGEIKTLKWSYIKESHIELPDSKTGPRRIPLPPAARAILNKIPRDLTNDYVVVGEVPGQHNTDLQKPWRRIRKRAGLEDVRIHDLRHTYASNAVSQGMSIPLVGKLLGHTQIQTTMRYAHLADDPVREAAEQVSSDLAKAIGTGLEPREATLRIIK